MSDARVHNLYAIVDATQASGGNANTVSLYAVADITASNHQIAKVASITAITDTRHQIAACTTIYAIVDATLPGAFRIGSITARVWGAPPGKQVKVTNVHILVQAARVDPYKVETSHILATVDARMTTPRADTIGMAAIINSRTTTPPVETIGMTAIVNAIMPATIAQAGGTTAIVQAQHQIAACYGACLIVNAVPATEIQTTYLSDRMRHGKRSKIGAISPYGDS